MTRLLAGAAAALALTWTSAVVAQNAAGPARAQLNAFSAGLDTLHARFEQAVMRPSGDIDSEGAGELWLARPGLLRWRYEGEFPELIVADGARVWNFDEALEQVIVKPQSELIDDSPLAMLTDPDLLDARFDTREMGGHEDLQYLELVPSGQEDDFERILLGFDDDLLRIMILEDAFGLRTELRFLELERNPALDPALFSFRPPPGADVVGDAGL